MNKKILIWVSAFVIAVAAVLVAMSKNTLNQEKITAKRGDVVESIYGLGTVTADQTFNVRTGVAITVNKVFVKEGEKVAKGQQLVQIDGAVIRSPIEGVATRIAFKDGELVAPQVSIVTITNLEKLYLEVSLEQQSILRVKAGESVNVSFETLRNEKFIGKVKTVYPRENQFIVRIELDNWPAGVMPGMTADTAIIVGKKSNVLLIPINSISAGKVTRIRNGNKEKVAVKLGVVDSEWAEVVSDSINETDEILVRKK